MMADSPGYRETYAGEKAWVDDDSVGFGYSLTKFDDICFRQEPSYSLELSSVSVGSCLAQWIKGIRVVDNHCGFVFEMYSSRASCCFIVNDSYVYCGAGRYGVCDAGLFSSLQGFRIFKSGDRLDAYMLQNLNLTMQDLVIEEDNFDHLTCSSVSLNAHVEWTPWAGMYFPVKEAKENVIVLSGCNNDYAYVKDDPARSSYFD